MKHCDRSSSCLVGLLGVLGLVASCERAIPASELAGRLAALDRPNVALVLVDTLRADWTTPYGFEHDTSPEPARWAERGIVF